MELEKTDDSGRRVGPRSKSLDRAVDGEFMEIRFRPAGLLLAAINK